MNQQELQDFINMLREDMERVKCSETVMVLKNIIFELQDYVKEEQANE